MKKIAVLLLLPTIALTACAQTKDRQVGGPCEACNLFYEDMPKQMNASITIPPAGEPGEPLIVSGTIYHRDGKTPAPGVVLYVYHTDNAGYYSPPQGKKGNRHGHLRGWMKTDEKGHYEFRTIRPAHYPERKIEAHIHPLIKEPGLSIYWIDEFLFDDDPLLTQANRQRLENRGGNGVLKLTRVNGIWIGHRDITLGLNVPGYDANN